MEMKRHHKEKLQNTDHDQLEAHLRHPQSNEYSTHKLLERTQEGSHPRRIINTQDGPSLSHIHRLTGRTSRWQPFIDRIMEVDKSLGWRPLNQERYDGTIDPDEHLDAFLTKENLYTND